MHTVDNIRQAFDPGVLQRVAYRRGVDGALLERAFVALRACLATRDECGSEAWLLLKRPLDPDSEDLKQYLITAPATTPLVELARLAHVRPRIERSSYDNAKGAAGLADYQGRSWPGFHRHLAMVWLAMTWLDRLRRPLPPDEAPQGPPATGGASQHGADAGTASEPPDVNLAFDAGSLAVRGATYGTPDHRSLPRQVWESLQSVHRRFVDWCRAAGFHELLLLNRCPIPWLLAPEGSVT